MITFDSWKNSSQYFNYKNHSIAYWSEGSGPPLLLIHGFPTASWDWHKMWPDLIKKFSIYACDMIGFGYSSKPGDYDYSITDQARLQEAFIQHLGINNIHLLVHDYGVSVTQELLASFNEKSNGGIEYMSCSFLNGGLFPELHHARPIQKVLNSPLGFLIGRLLSKRSLRKSFHNIYGDRKPSEMEIDQFYELVTNNNGKAIIHKLIRYINDRRENAFRWKKALIESTIPLQMINGPLDPVSGRHLANFFQNLLPQAKVDILEGVGHYPQDEAPDQVLQAYLKFITPLL